MKIPIKYKDKTILLDEEFLQEYRDQIAKRDFILIPSADPLWTYEIVKEVTK